MSGAPARVLAPKQATQASLFEAEPYRVARPRPGVARSPARLGAAARPALGAPRAAATTSRPALTVTQAPEYSRSLMPFVAMCVGIVVASLVAVLMLNTTMTQRAYEARRRADALDVPAGPWSSTVTRTGVDWSPP